MPLVIGNTITWASQTILKDKDKIHLYNGANLVTILSGQSVYMWQPRSVLHLVGSDWVEEPTQLVLKPAKPNSFDEGCITRERSSRSFTRWKRCVRLCDPRADRVGSAV